MEVNMRRALLACAAAVVFAAHANAQLTIQETPPPMVTAASALWQINGEAIFYEGNFYYPAGATIFFDGAVMSRTGDYMGVPLYQDRTLEPYSVVYVPIGGTLMKPYERRRSGELAGTTGSRAPSFPVESPYERPLPEPLIGYGTGRSYTPRFVPTAGIVPIALVSEPPSAVSIILATRLQTTSVPAPASDRRVWINYMDRQWFLAGTAVRFTAERFARIGEYDGFPVYREIKGRNDVVWVAVVTDGPVAPYSAR